MPLATYIAWAVMAGSLAAGGAWYWRVGRSASSKTRCRVAFLIAGVFAINGLVNSAWLGVLREGSVDAALSALGIATALITGVLQFLLGLVLAWSGARLVQKLLASRESHSGAA